MKKADFPIEIIIIIVLAILAGVIMIYFITGSSGSIQDKVLGLFNLL